jgi:serine/threonine-protein phosphatase 2B catalytic subunit
MEPLKDPVGDRFVKSHPPPPARPLTEQLLYPDGSKKKPDCDQLRRHLLREGTLTKETLLEIVGRVTEVYRSEPTLIKCRDPITVVGDIHGQYYDFVKLLDVGGDPTTTQTQYIFLGDYVDRGSYSVEVLALIFCLKICYPKKIWMLRGNHECRQMTSFFNFRDECECKYDLTVYNAFMDAFDALPLACVINGKFLAIHGGLSPELVSLKQIDRLDRFHEPPREGLLCDVLWADPMEEREGETTKHSELFIRNEVRGCSWFFTYEAATSFLYKNSLLSVIRAHEAQIEGYKMHRTNNATGFPTVITIFSAPNYCDVYNNKGAILKFDNNTLNILQFNFSAHPYHLPNFMDVFTWSLPFVVEKVTEMLYYMLQPAHDEPEESIDEQALPPAVNKIMRNSLSIDQNEVINLAARLAENLEKQGDSADGDKPKASASAAAERNDRLRKKVRTIARMARMFKTLRQENESVIRLKGVCPGHRLPPGLLLAGKQGLDTELERFDHAKNVDMLNEKRPDAKPKKDGAAAAADGKADAKPDAKNPDAKDAAAAK